MDDEFGAVPQVVHPVFPLKARQHFRIVVEHGDTFLAVRSAAIA